MTTIDTNLLQLLFVQFLKKHDSLDSFVRQQNKSSTLLGFVLNQHSVPFELLQHAFSWSHSKEGFSYWSKLDSQWRNLLSQLL